MSDGAAAMPVHAGDSISQEHLEKHIVLMTSYSWNVFRYIGDYLHLFGIFILLVTIAKNRSCHGVSRSTQILYFFIFMTRYLDLFDHSQTAYLVFFKVTYIITSCIILLVFWKLDSTYERNKDTCSLVCIFIPCTTAAILLASEYSALEVLWTFSQFLEGFAMVPQYIFCYRDRTRTDLSIRLYVLSFGGYRVFYAANWIYKKIQMPHYNDMQSWIGGIIEICFFSDYILSLLTGYSLLRAVVLSVDEKINEIQATVEMKVLGSNRASRQAVVQQHGNELRQRRGGGRGDENPNPSCDDVL